ncbi:NAD(P)H-dependent oxidoreductase [Methylopila henanensis]|uniref:NAD(P)H-dependent oxidoreductase n=1 Tax=Methylopila henanensis TaxID=873516 RepID=A0ABW4K963_9HYPH
MALMVSINGSPRRNSRTGELLDAVCYAISGAVSLERASVNLATDGRHIMSGLTRDELEPRGEDLLRLVERADLLIVGSPVYRASYTGLLKHLFDLVERTALTGRKAVLVASGGTALHGLMLEHQLRPLLGFFGVLTVPTAIYALDSDFDGGRVMGADLINRITRAAQEAVNVISAYTASEGRLATVA